MGDRDELIQREIGSHLRRRRETLGLTQEEVASLASGEGVAVSSSKLSRVEKGTAAVSLQVGSALFHTLGSSLNVVDEVVRTARTRKIVDVTGATLEELFEEGMARFRDGHILEALDHFEAAQDWILLKPDLPDRDERLATALIWEADCYFRVGNFALALQAAARPLDRVGTSDDTRVRVLLLHVNIYRETGAFFQAEMYAKKAQELVGRTGPATKAFAAGVIGRLHRAVGRHREAVEALTQSREEYQKLGREIEVARANVSLGESHHHAGHPDNGLRLVEEGYRLARSKKYREVEVSALRVLGVLHGLRGDPTKACSFLEKAAASARRIGHIVEEFLAWYEYWKVCLATADAAGKRRGRRELKRLLPRVSPRLPEVIETTSFLEEEAATAGGRRHG